MVHEVTQREFNEFIRKHAETSVILSCGIFYYDAQGREIARVSFPPQPAPAEYDRYIIY